MAHPLDRPFWNALTTRQAHFAEGDDRRAVRLGADFGLFAASRDLEPENLAALAALIPAGGAIGMAETLPIPPPPGTVLAMQVDYYQMIASEITAGHAGFDVTALGDGDADEMLSPGHPDRTRPLFPPRAPAG